MPDSSSDRNPVERLAEELLERYCRSGRPALREYTDRHSELVEALLFLARREKSAVG
jgi:hypothetical protein